MENTGIKSQDRCIADLDKGYLIDYYQRDYKWTKEHINILFEDLLLKFEPAYEKNQIKNWHGVVDEQAQGYNWYYLSTIITVQKNDKYVVDGQQRLTTLCLMLIALYHYSDENMQKFLENNAILCKKDSSECKIFLIADNNDQQDNEKRSVVFTKLLEHLNLDISQEIDNSSNTNIQNMYKNYKYIYAYISGGIEEKNVYCSKKFLDENGKIDMHKLHHFIAFFIYKVLLIDIKISNSIDVPMVFEVINDRGEKLRPYEILKGKLLAKAAHENNDQIKTLNDSWNKTINRLIQSNHINSKINNDEIIDQFFVVFLRARMRKSRDNFQSTDIRSLNESNYHKHYQRLERILKIDSSQGVIQFVTETLLFYAGLYIRLHEYIYWDEYIKMRDNAVLLAMSVIDFEDSQEGDKIKIIMYLVDRSYVIMQLCNIWESNQFNNDISSILTKLEGKSIKQYQGVFDDVLQQTIKNRSEREVNKDLLYKYTRIRELRSQTAYKFLRYFFMRIEDLLRESCDEELILDQVSHRDKGLLNQLFMIRSQKNGTAYTIEHIIAVNDENARAISKHHQDNEYNSEFYEKRERLGALTILKGSANSTSRNEYYKDKLKRYKKNERLVNNMLMKSESFTIRGKEFTPPVYANVRDFITKGIREREEMFLEFARIIWDF